VRVLLDTHTLFWLAEAPAMVTGPAMAVIQVPTNEVILSAASIWELAIKVGIGKLALSMPYRQWMETAIKHLKLSVLPVTVEYADRVAILPQHHRDPFDRLMIAQALVDNIPIVSNDATFDKYGISGIW
jgi:PIN domain nuclease of toxin-antitoxin system